MKRKPWWKRGGFLGLIALLLFAVCFLLAGAVPLYKTIASSNWPVTTGRVAKIDVSTTDPAYGENDQLRYTIFVKFDYIVGNIKHSNTRMVLSASDSFLASVITKKYALGNKVDIYFNPDNPDQFVLHSGQSWSSYGSIIIVIFGLILTGITILLLSAELRNSL